MFVKWKNCLKCFDQFYTGGYEILKSLNVYVNMLCVCKCLLKVNGKFVLNIGADIYEDYSYSMCFLDWTWIIPFVTVYRKRINRLSNVLSANAAFKGWLS